MTGRVVIVGAGPAGLLLAAELRLAGIDTVVLERHAEHPGFCRGFNLNARALDLLARRGLDRRFVDEGWQVGHAAFSGLPVTLDLAGTATDHPFSLGIPQTRVEEILEERAIELGADIRRGHAFAGLDQDDDGVTVHVGTGYRIRAEYVVGCDGGRSDVRKSAGIAFPGTASTRFTLLGDVELAEEGALPFGMTGSVFTIPRPGYVRIVTEDPEPDRDEPVTLQRFQAALDRALGRHVAVRAPRWLTRFGNAARQAEQYVKGRVILAGDAAHIHPPAGAIGVNVALDDAFNLGWKLAATVRGDAPEGLLASYHEERHAVGVQLLASTRAQVLLGEPDGRLAPLVELLTRVASHPGGNRAFTETLTGLDTRYPMHLSAEHPLLGRLARDVPLWTNKGETRLASLLTSGRGVLIDRTEDRAFLSLAEGWHDRIALVGASGLAPRAVLLRPDGHTAWAAHDEPSDQDSADLDSADLESALRRWHGSPRHTELASAAR
ncbi:FAD-dependent monooxygenase [Amycolatopsis sp. CA-230715]|uniref:FAD-dependent monooxygenase n=1 Tax=Amycolatopsis sp. CA-230715 TaxID=2745196 RepID=UPI001C0252E9|nr:FAD-dependent monooxygenase [Amycolatopsis sp. CA-230715]QWF83245.1 Anhydrotetracycline monooxygenase [Amycolatopsis sp. CA-230715]